MEGFAFKSHCKLVYFVAATAAATATAASLNRRLSFTDIKTQLCKASCVQGRLMPAEESSRPLDSSWEYGRSQHQIAWTE